MTIRELNSNLLAFKEAVKPETIWEVPAISSKIDKLVKGINLSAASSKEITEACRLISDITRPSLEEENELPAGMERVLENTMIGLRELKSKLVKAHKETREKEREPIIRFRVLLNALNNQFDLDETQDQEHIRNYAELLKGFVERHGDKLDFSLCSLAELNTFAHLLGLIKHNNFVKLADGDVGYKSQEVEQALKVCAPLVENNPSRSPRATTIQGEIYVARAEIEENNAQKALIQKINDNPLDVNLDELLDVTDSHKRDEICFLLEKKNPALLEQFVAAIKGSVKKIVLLFSDYLEKLEQALKNKKPKEIDQAFKALYVLPDFEKCSKKAIQKFKDLISSIRSHHQHKKIFDAMSLLSRQIEHDTRPRPRSQDHVVADLIPENE